MRAKQMIYWLYENAGFDRAWLVVPCESCDGLTLSDRSFVDEKQGRAFLASLDDSSHWLDAHPEIISTRLPWTRVRNDSLIATLPA